MKIPDIRFFLPDDFEEVVTLLESEGFRPPPTVEFFRGVPLVAREDTDEEERPIVGFIWAMAQAGYPTAYVDYFAVRSDLRKTSIGVFLGMTLAKYLQEMGVGRILWVTPNWNRGFIRTMLRRGGEDLGVRQVIATDLTIRDAEVKGNERVVRE